MRQAYGVTNATRFYYTPSELVMIDKRRTALRLEDKCMPSVVLSRTKGIVVSSATYKYHHLYSFGAPVTRISGEAE
jgi:hypothetical protein